MMGGVSRLSVAAAVLLFGASGALAEDESVARRLTKHGQLRRGESESLAEAVSKRMKRAADMANPNDPLRLAVGRALGANPSDAMGAAKIRLRLYAGLNEWALDNLFAPRPGGLGRCQQEIGVTLRQCEALIAAAGRVPAEEASRLAGGPPPPMPSAQPAPAQRPMAPPAGGSRFGQRYDSGYRPAAQPVARPTPQPAARPMAPVAQPVAQTNTRDEYQRRREEYLERKRLEMEARKAKLVAASGSAVQRGPAADSAAAPAPVSQAKASDAPVKPTPAAAPAEAAAEQAPAAAAPSASKQALDGDLLDSLLSDPLGGK